VKRQHSHNMASIRPWPAAAVAPAAAAATATAAEALMAAAATWLRASWGNILQVKKSARKEPAPPQPPNATASSSTHMCGVHQPVRVELGERTRERDHAILLLPPTTLFPHPFNSKSLLISFSIGGGIISPPSPSNKIRTWNKVRQSEEDQDRGTARGRGREMRGGEGGC
jgi:hypothetical protein